MSRRTEIILYVMTGVVCLTVFIFIHPLFKRQFRSERGPVQLSVDPSQASARRSILSHRLPERPVYGSPKVRTLKEPGETAAGNVPRTPEDLDRAFEKFLISQGLPTKDLRRMLSSPVAVGKKIRARRAQVGTEVDPVILESFRNEYPVTGIRLGKSDEIWLRMDSRDIEKVSLGQMMAAAAELKEDLGTPVKVVVWAGNRPVAVRTFFGEPIF